MIADTTAKKQPIGRPFEPGQSGNPAGRPKGSRNKLSECFLKALADDFDINGIAVIESVRKDRPHEYLKIVAAVLPKQMQLEGEIQGFVMRIPDMAASTDAWEGSMRPDTEPVKHYGRRYLTVC